MIDGLLDLEEPKPNDPGPRDDFQDLPDDLTLDSWGPEPGGAFARPMPSSANSWIDAVDEVTHEDDYLPLHAEQAAHTDTSEPTGPESRNDVGKPGIGSVDSRKLDEIATRLERIARSIRERGPGGPLAEVGTDPLGAVITGYLLGLSEMDGR